MSFLSSVRVRLVLWNVGVLAIVLALFGYALRFEIQSDLMDGIDAGLTKSAERAQQTLVATRSLPMYLLQRQMPVHPVKNSVQQSTATTTFSQPLSFAISWIDRTGNTHTPGALVLDPSSAARSLKGQRVFSTSMLNGEQVRIYSTPIYLHGQVYFALQFARSLSQLNSEMTSITRGLFTLIPLALLVVGVGALLLAERALLPVRDIVDSTERIEAKDLSGRLTVTGRDEFSHLAVTINGMLARLDRSFTLLKQASEKQRRFTADASHELRTPLTIIKANTSLTLSVERTPDEYRRTLQAVDKAADRMSKIVNDLLYIARSDAGEIFTAPEPVNLFLVVKQAIESVVDVDEHSVKVEVSSDNWVSGEEESLVRLFANLLQNAYKYTPRYGAITFRSSTTENLQVVRVIDTGAGIAPEHIKHLGERFFRVDDARARDVGGTGLGLAICRSIVESHGGSIEFESVEAHGTTVIVSLPIADRSEPARTSEPPEFARVQ